MIIKGIYSNFENNNMFERLIQVDDNLPCSEIWELVRKYTCRIPYGSLVKVEILPVEKEDGV